jgi:large subunit ribosomal protein L25
MESVPLSVDARELTHVLHQGSNVLIDLNVGKDKFLTLAKDINRDHIKGRYVHVDFLAIDKDQKITVNIPVTPVGSSRGVKEGGVLEHHMWEIEVECLPFDVPESVEVDVSDLGIGDNVHVSDLSVASGVEILSDPEELVLAVIQPQAPIEVEEEAVEGEAVEGETPAEGAAEGDSGSSAPSQEGGES